MEQGLLAGPSFLGCSAGRGCQVLPFNGANACALICVTGSAMGRAETLGFSPVYLFIFLFALEAKNPLLQSQCLGSLLTRGSHDILKVPINLGCFFPYLWEGERTAESCSGVPVTALRPAKGQGTVPSYI